MRAITHSTDRHLLPGRNCGWSALLVIAVTLVGCAGTQYISSPADRADSPMADVTAKTDAAPVGRTFALLNGQPIEMADLETGLFEAGGGQVLVELVLHRGVSSRLAAAGTQLNKTQIDYERTVLMHMLHKDANHATRMLTELRRRRGLGEQRFARMLKTNAGLRALIQPDVQIADFELRKQYEFEHGKRFQARLITVASAQMAAIVIQRARAGEMFIDLAMRFSTDESSVTGGYMPPISPVDPTYPLVIRDTLTRMILGTISEPITLGGTFAIVKLERIIEADGVPFDDVIEDLTTHVRLRVEQMLMQQRVHSIINEADLTVLDATLKRTWERQKRQAMELPK